MSSLPVEAVASAIRSPHDDPAKWRSLALSAAVHLLLIAALFLGVQWKSKPSSPVEVEVWHDVPSAPVTTVPLDTRPEPKPAKPEPKPDATPRPEPLVKPLPRPEPKPEPKPIVKPLPRPEPKPEPKPVIKPLPRPEPKPVTKGMPRPEPKIEPKPPPKPDIPISQEKKTREATKKEESKPKDLPKKEEPRRREAPKNEEIKPKEPVRKEEPKPRESERKEEPKSREAPRKSESERRPSFDDELKREQRQLQQQKAEQHAVQDQRLRAEAEARQIKQLQAEQTAAEHKRALAEYIEKVRGKIRGNISLPPNIQGNPEAVFEVTQLPTGEVLDIKVRRSSGNPSLDAAVERAIRRSSPLPRPSQPELFERVLKIPYKPHDA